MKRLYYLYNCRTHFQFIGSGLTFGSITQQKHNNMFITIDNRFCDNIDRQPKVKCITMIENTNSFRRASVVTD